MAFPDTVFVSPPSDTRISLTAGFAPTGSHCTVRLVELTPTIRTSTSEGRPVAVPVAGTTGEDAGWLFTPMPVWQK